MPAIISRAIQFSVYYVKMRSSVKLGMHRTYNPLSVKWRWHQWQIVQDVKERRAHSVGGHIPRTVRRLRNAADHIYT